MTGLLGVAYLIAALTELAVNKTIIKVLNRLALYHSEPQNVQLCFFPTGWVTNKKLAHYTRRYN